MIIFYITPTHQQLRLARPPRILPLPITKTKAKARTVTQKKQAAKALTKTDSRFQKGPASCGCSRTAKISCSYIHKGGEKSQSWLLGKGKQNIC